MRQPNYFLGFVSALFLLGTAFAQSVRWDPPGGQLGFNQVSELSLVFENCEPDGDPRLPSVDGLAFGRPSQNAQTSIVNFKMTRTFSFVFPVRPSKKSNITIPAFEIKTDKGAVKVPAATYTVGDATVGNSGLAVDAIATAKLETPKLTYWAGEVFPVNYTLNVVRRYFHSLATNVEWQPTPLVAEDWTKPDPSEVLLQGERRVISNQSTRAYAKQTGVYSIKPASQMVNLMVGTAGFGIFAQASVEQRQLDTKPLDLTIKPLPTPPADFSGAVGEFAFVSKVVPTTAAIGEPVTWTLELTGVGNWPDLTGLPQREVSNDFQVVQPKSKRTMKDGALFEGTLTEDVVLVPTRAGSYQLAPVRFTYFDTKSGTYKTITSAPVTVTITAAAPSPTPTSPNAPIQFSLPAAASSNPPALPAAPAAVAPVPPENLPRDPLTGSARGFTPLAMRPLVFACLAAAVLVPLVLWIMLAAQRSKLRDPQRQRREALAKLKNALKALHSQTSAPDALRAQLIEWQHQTATLWSVRHAAPSAHMVGPDLRAGRGAASSPPSLPGGQALPAQHDIWPTLWNEADRAIHGRSAELPGDWVARAETAATAVKVPGWTAVSLLAPRNLFPFFFALVLALTPLAAQADPAGDAYKKGDFAAASTEWSKAVATAPSDWIARHNLGLALAQQDRWAEATAHWTGAFLLNPRSETARWDLALGLQRSGMAPPALLEFSRGDNLYRIPRLATPGEWQLVLIFASLLLAGAVSVMLLKGYRRIGGWALPASLLGSVVAVVLAGAATFSLHTYGDLANPSVAMIWKAGVLRSIPTDVDTTQKTTPLSAGTFAITEKTFLGWTKLTFAGGQSGWVRTEDLIKLYR